MTHKCAITDLKLTYMLEIYNLQGIICMYSPECIFETPVGLDPDFWSQRTRTLGLTRVLKNSDFGSDQNLVQKKLRPKSLKWTGFLMGESYDHAFWESCQVLQAALTVIRDSNQRIYWKTLTKIELCQKRIYPSPQGKNILHIPDS